MATEALLQKALEIDSELEVKQLYSGRSMFGKYAELAFVSDVPPYSTAGAKLQALNLACDNMGKSWIYYTR